MPRGDRLNDPRAVPAAVAVVPGPQSDHGGGILGLLELLDEHQEAVEYDLIALGLRLRDLGTPILTWRDLLVIIRQLPETSALVRELRRDAPEWWPRTDQLLAAVFDQLAILAWQNTDDARNGRNKPEPLPRPGIEPVNTYGSEAIPIDEMADWLGWERQLTEGPEGVGQTTE